MPTFTSAFVPVNSTFSDASFVAVEIWEKRYAFPTAYIGGAELLVSQLKALPHLTQIPIASIDRKAVGTLSVEWK